MKAIGGKATSNFSAEKLQIMMQATKGVALEEDNQSSIGGAALEEGKVDFDSPSRELGLSCGVCQGKDPKPSPSWPMSVVQAMPR